MNLTIQLLDTRRHAIAVQVAIRRDMVDFRYQDRLVGIADRDHLRSWLNAPFGVLVYDDCTWLELAGGIALGIERVCAAHVLDRLVLADLRSLP